MIPSDQLGLLFLFFFRSTITEVIRQPLKGLFYGAMPIAWREKGFWN